MRKTALYGVLVFMVVVVCLASIVMQGYVCRDYWRFVDNEALIRQQWQNEKAAWESRLRSDEAAHQKKLQILADAEAQCAMRRKEAEALEDKHKEYAALTKDIQEALENLANVKAMIATLEKQKTDLTVASEQIKATNEANNQLLATTQATLAQLKEDIKSAEQLILIKNQIELIGSIIHGQQNILLIIFCA